MNNNNYIWALRVFSIQCLLKLIRRCCSGVIYCPDLRSRNRWRYSVVPVTFLIAGQVEPITFDYDNRITLFNRFVEIARQISNCVRQQLFAFQWFNKITFWCINATRQKTAWAMDAHQWKYSLLLSSAPCSVSHKHGRTEQHIKHRGVTTNKLTSNSFKRMKKTGIHILKIWPFLQSKYYKEEITVVSNRSAKT